MPGCFTARENILFKLPVWFERLGLSRAHAPRQGAARCFPARGKARRPFAERRPERICAGRRSGPPGG